MKVTHAQFAGEKRGKFFYYLMGPQGVSGVCILTKKENAELDTVESVLDFLKTKLKFSIVSARGGNWSCWLFARYSNLPTPKEGIVFLVNGQEGAAYVVDPNQIHFVDWWYYMTLKTVGKEKHWCLEGTDAIYPLKERHPIESASLILTFNKITSALGAGTKISAKEDRRNGNVIIKTTSSHRLPKVE